MYPTAQEHLIHAQFVGLMKPESFNLFILSVKKFSFSIVHNFLIHERPSPITLRSHFNARGLTGNDVVHFLNFAPFYVIAILLIFYYMDTCKFLKWSSIACLRIGY